jgi:parallel beta-helix repeat protein
MAAMAADFKVMPGQSIQAAVDQASPGDKVTVMPGVYHEAGRPCPSQPSVTCAVVISKNDISLVAQSLPFQPVILENAGGQDTGIAVARQGAAGATCLTDASQRIHGARVEGFTVRNFGGSGILLFCVDDWSVRFNTATNNREYGIFPVFCGDGRLSMNTASGAHDTGIYIGLSHDARVDHNVAYDNVSGFEVENSVNIELDHNESFHNTAGILVFLIPGFRAPVNRKNHVHENLVHENNSANTCLNPADEVCLVPPGIGILLVGGEQNEIDHNLVFGNETFGIALSDFCTASQIPGAVCSTLPFDPLPESTRIESNTALGNGSHPQFPGLPGADLIWSANGTGDCWRENRAALIVPEPLPACR